MNPRPLWAVVALTAAGFSGIAAHADNAPPGKQDNPPPQAGQTPPTAPTTPPQAKDSRDEEIQLLKKQLADIQRRLEELEKAKDQKPETPAPPPEPAPAPEPPKASATLLPNISAVGNIIFRGGDRSTIEGRGRTHFEEFELAFQDDFAPGLRYDTFLSAAKGEDWKLGLEEGYVTATRLAQGLSARIGQIRTPVGKFNTLHPHSWPTVSQPSVITAFMGPEGLVGDGAVLQYNIPVKGMFARAELGYWGTTSDKENGLGFGGGDNGAASGRLWFGKEVGKNKEFELGFSRYQGRGDIHGVDGKMKSLTGLDFTYRAFPGSYRRYLVTGEFLAHQSDVLGGGGSSTRLGGFLEAAYRMNRYWEAGLRGDYTKFPYPLNGREWAGSVFITKYITEQTSLRLEYQYGNSTLNGNGSGVFLQLLFGSGPHTHPLQ